MERPSTRATNELAGHWKSIILELIRDELCRGDHNMAGLSATTCKRHYSVVMATLYYFRFSLSKPSREKGGYAWSDIDLHTWFAIHQLLQIQDDLRIAAEDSDSTGWDAGPLVWYFSYRGEQWRVMAAFPKRDQDVRTYVSVTHGLSYRIHLTLFCC